MKNVTTNFLFPILMALSLVACSSSMKRSSDSQVRSSSRVAPVMEMAEQAEEDSFYGDSAQEEVLAESAPSRLEAPGSPAPAKSSQANRKVFYNGSIKLEVASPKEMITTLIEDVKKLGGYVESQTNSTVTLRIPVKKFRSVFDDTLKRGVVLQRSIEARDITREFQDLELRKKFLQTSLNKFYALLKTAKSSSEKISILREITSLKERLQWMRARLAQLDNLARFSKLAVSAVGRNRQPAGEGGHQIRAFNWIEQLSPNRRTIAVGGAKLEPNLPAQFVEVDKRRHWESQTSGKSSFWASKQKNKLEAGTEFWIKTIQHKMKGRFAISESYSKGKVKGLRFEDGVGQKYSYHIQVLATEDNIFVFETSFPSLEEEKKHLDHVLRSVASYAKGVEDDI